MRSFVSLTGALLLAGCSGAPEPLPYPDLEARDHRFAPPARREAAPLLDKSELTLEDALAITEALHPGLAWERTSLDVAAAVAWEAGLYPNPSLLLEMEDYRTRDGATMGKMERTAGLAIPLVLSGRLGKAESAAQADREAAALTYLWRRREILSETKRAFVALLAARRTVELARESRDLARSARESSDERVRAQAVPEMEALKAAVALARAEIDLKRAQRDSAGALKSLQAALGDPDFPKDAFLGELVPRFQVPSLDALRGLVTGAHPRLAAAARAKEAAELELAVARAERIPDPHLEILAGRDPQDFTIIEAGISIPLPLFNRNQARIARAEARIHQAELQRQLLRNELILRLADAHRTLLTAQEAVALYQDEILPKAERAAAQTAEGYRLGKFGALELLDAQRTLAEARTASVAALSDLNLAAVELEKLTGLRLDPQR